MGGQDSKPNTARSAARADKRLLHGPKTSAHYYRKICFDRTFSDCSLRPQAYARNDFQDQVQGVKEEKSYPSGREALKTGAGSSSKSANRNSKAGYETNDKFVEQRIRSGPGLRNRQDLASPDEKYHSPAPLQLLGGRSKSEPVPAKRQAVPGP